MIKIIISIILFAFSHYLFSQIMWEKGNEVINLPKSDWIIGCKKISVYKVQNKEDTIIASEEIYDKGGNRLGYTEFNEETGIVFKVVNYSYREGKLIEINEKSFRNRKYYYNGQNIIKVKLWSYNKDTSIADYFYNEENELIKLKSSENNSTILFEYNPRHQLISRSINGLVFMKYDYDSNGNLLKEYSPERKRIDKSYKYDEHNRLIEFILHNDPYAHIGRRVYMYDENNRLIEWTEFSGNKVFKIIRYSYKKSGKETFIYYKRIKKKPDDFYIERYEYWGMD